LVIFCNFLYENEKKINSNIICGGVEPDVVSKTGFSLTSRAACEGSLTSDWSLSCHGSLRMVVCVLIIAIHDIRSQLSPSVKLYCKGDYDVDGLQAICIDQPIAKASNLPPIKDSVTLFNGKSSGNILYRT